MPQNFTVLAIAILLAGSGTGARAQESPAGQTGAVGEIGVRLRSFYFNLAHNDWEALTADILAAKVVAHRPTPPRLELASDSPGPDSVAADCAGGARVSLEQAAVTIQNDWAEVSVPHCTPVVGRDEFRLIRFADRWRFVSIQLFQQPVDVTAGR